jgi:hypothetical protein
MAFVATVAYRSGAACFWSDQEVGKTRGVRGRGRNEDEAGERGPATAAVLGYRGGSAEKNFEE